MTLEDAYELLNQGEIKAVADAMKEWHPAILGEMLLAIQLARETRYLSPHADYMDALKTCITRELHIQRKRAAAPRS